MCQSLLSLLARVHTAVQLWFIILCRSAGRVTVLHMPVPPQLPNNSLTGWVCVCAEL
jgi:hypothetical protein